MAEAPVFVSNLDFRGTRLRQIEEWALTGPCGRREKRPPERPRIEAGVPRRSWPSTFWSRCGPGLLDVHLSPGLDPGLRPGAWHPVSGRCFPARTGENPNRRPQRHPPRALVSPRSNRRGSPQPSRGSPGVQNNRPDIRKQSQEASLSTFIRRRWHRQVDRYGKPDVAGLNRAINAGSIFCGAQVQKRLPGGHDT